MDCKSWAVLRSRRLALELIRLFPDQLEEERTNALAATPTSAPSTATAQGNEARIRICSGVSVSGALPGTVTFRLTSFDLECPRFPPGIEFSLVSEDRARPGIL